RRWRAPIGKAATTCDLVLRLVGGRLSDFGGWSGYPFDGGNADQSQRAARSLCVSTRGTARGAFVRSSKNGVGRPSPRTHQRSIIDVRRPNYPSAGGPGGFGG